MGSHTSFAIHGYEIASTKNCIDPEAMMLFTEAERVTGCRAMTDGWGKREDVNDEEEKWGIGYFARGLVLIDRLEVMGFSLNLVKEVFELKVAEKVRELSDPTWGRSDTREIELYKQLTFDVWIGTMRSLIQKGIQYWDLTLREEDREVRELSPMERFLLEESYDAGILRNPYGNLRLFVRAVLEACGPEATCYLDITEVVGGGWNDPALKFTESAREQLTADYPFNAKIIVLTEGVSDRRAIEGALQFLHPHLVEYYSFMDFETASVPGGAGRLVTTLKSFAGAGIKNRVIGLFDNDTAAASALRGLDMAALPSHMRVIKFPKLPLCMKYPTVGPTGTADLDVNGLAGSLELYFGEDVLRNGTGALSPIHWRGYDAAMKAYQGEVEHKAELQERFHRKLQAALKDRVVSANQDWSGMRAIWEAVRGAF